VTIHFREPICIVSDLNTSKTHGAGPFGSIALIWAIHTEISGPSVLLKGREPTVGVAITGPMPHAEPRGDAANLLPPSAENSRYAGMASSKL
jgi:hypothetical protein